MEYRVDSRDLKYQVFDWLETERLLETPRFADWDRESLEILLPHVTALPGRTPVNVNTASAAVLQSLGPNFEPSDAEGLIQLREDGGFVDYATVFAPLVDPDLQPWISDTTSFFRLNAIVQIDTVRISLFTVLYRDQDSPDVVPIRRSLGTL